MAEWLKGNNNLVNGLNIKFRVICQLQQLREWLIDMSGLIPKGHAAEQQFSGSAINNSVLCTQLCNEK